MILGDNGFEVIEFPEHEHDQDQDPGSRIYCSKDEIRGEYRTVPARPQRHAEDPCKNGVHQDSERYDHNGDQVDELVEKFTLFRRIAIVSRHEFIDGVSPFANSYGMIPHKSQVTHTSQVKENETADKIR